MSNAAKGVARVGDITGNFGVIISNYSPNVRINGRNAAHLFSRISPHWPFPLRHIHGVSFITRGANKVLANGKPIAHVGSNTLCGHSVRTGSRNVVVG